MQVSGFEFNFGRARPFSKFFEGAPRQDQRQHIIHVCHFIWPIPHVPFLFFFNEIRPRTSLLERHLNFLKGHFDEEYVNLYCIFAKGTQQLLRVLHGAMG